jgi:hypothetical protein
MNHHILLAVIDAGLPGLSIPGAMYDKTLAPRITLDVTYHDNPDAHSNPLTSCKWQGNAAMNVVSGQACILLVKNWVKMNAPTQLSALHGVNGL